MSEQIYEMLNSKDKRIELFDNADHGMSFIVDSNRYNKVEKFVKNNSNEGYLLQIKATYMNIFDPVKSQELLLSAKKCNRGVLNPIEGYQHQKITNTQEQVHNIIEYTKSIYQNQQTLIIHLHLLLLILLFQRSEQLLSFHKVQLHNQVLNQHVMHEHLRYINYV